MERQAKDGTFYQKIGPDEWAPVTRMAKDGTTFKKVGVDEWAPLASANRYPQDDESEVSQMESETPNISKVESLGRGTIQGATFGLADEISGGFEAAKDVLTTDKKLSDLSQLYEKRRDESRANFKAAEKANPGYYTAGEIAGGIASSVVPMGAATSIGRAAIVGGRAGAVSGFGYSEGKNLKEVVQDTGIGAGMGLAAGAFAKGAETGYKALRLLPQKNIQAAAQGGIESGVTQISDQTPSGFREVTKSVKNRLQSYFDPQIDPKFEEFKSIAEKNGINPNLLPESVKFGPDSSASRAARNLAEGKFGEETLKRFNEGLGQVREAYDRKILNYSKGLPVDEISAGKILRDSYDEGVTKFFDQMDFTHNSILDMAPGLEITPSAMEKIESSLNGVEKFAKGRLQRGVTDTQRKQGQQLLNAVEAIRSGNGSYKQTVEALRDIGEAAFQSKNSLADVPVDVQKMRKIYNDLNSGLIDTVRSNLGDDIANQLVANNKAMSEFFGDQSLVSRVMGDKAISPEQAFRSLILNGDSQKLQALRKIIPPEKWEYLKGATLENLARRDPEGDFTFKQLFSSMRGKKNSLASIFTPEELADNIGVVRLGDRFGSPVLSSSGTGASNSFNDIIKAASNATVDSLAIRNANKAAQNLNSNKKSFVSKVSNFNSKQPSEKIRSIVPKAAGAIAGTGVNENGLKGPEKWIANGTQKLIESDPTGEIITDELISELSKTRSGREILIRASDLKPGSQQLKNLVNKIKENYSKDGE